MLANFFSKIFQSEPDFSQSKKKDLEYGDFMFLKKTLTGEVFGFKAIGNSMYPSIKDGENIKVKVGFQKYLVGDVALFFNLKEKKIVLHRIIRKIEKNNKVYFVTKGDNNQSRDNFVVREDLILGKV